MTPMGFHSTSDSFNSGISPGSGKSFFIVVEQLTEEQKDLVPPEHHQQFLKISGNTYG